MDNAAKNENEVAAATEHALSDEMIAKVLEAEANSDEWVTLDELKVQLAKI